MARQHISFSILDIFDPKKIQKNIFLSQNVKKITFFKIGGTPAICLLIVEKWVFQ